MMDDKRTADSKGWGDGVEDCDRLEDGDPFPFGKHKNAPMEDVPADYLDWLRSQKWLGEWPGVKDYIERNKSVMDAELKEKDTSGPEIDLDTENIPW